jgi:2-desacetyl-2-hydroxyethyl bacteriochlorophyllide A dehydrogenase
LYLAKRGEEADGGRGFDEEWLAQLYSDFAAKLNFDDALPNRLRMQLMKAIVCRAPGDLAIEERPEPQRGGDEILVQIRRVGICGTDYHIYEGKHPFLQYPRVMGHELAAEVIEAPAASAFRPGQIVVVNPYISCGTCVACRHGKPNCCMRIAVLGVHRDGGMTERLSLPERNLYPAGGLSIDDAAAVEFLAIGAHGVRRAGVHRGDRCLVVGAGPIGLGAAIFATIDGATVTVMDRAPDRVRLVESIVPGATPVLAGDHPAETLAAATQGDGYDVVIDATGNRGSMESSFGYVAHGGTYVLLGLIRDNVSFSDPEFHKRETTLVASRNAVRGDFEHVIEALKAGRVPMAKLITHRTTLAAAAHDLAGWTTDKQGLVKALIEVA